MKVRRGNLGGIARGVTQLMYVGDAQTGPTDQQKQEATTMAVAAAGAAAIAIWGIPKKKRAARLFAGGIAAIMAVGALDRVA